MLCFCPPPRCISLSWGALKGGGKWALSFEFKGTRMRVSVHVYASTRIRDIIACTCARRVSDTRSRDVNMGR